MNDVKQQPLLAFLVALGGIAALSAMDAVMKGLSQKIGVFSTMCWRSILAAGLLAIPYFLFRRRTRPTPRAMRFHIIRAVLLVPMSFLFFWGLARVPMAQAIALTFVAPLLALGLAALLLGEPIGRRMLSGSLLAFAGILVIFVGQGRSDLGPEAVLGSIAILGSALCYAFNIIVMRRQAQNAGPLEIAFFQFLVTGVGFWLLAPVAGIPLYPAGQEGALVAATLLAIAGMVLLAWAYARAGAAYLSSSEYSGFLWAAALGWLVFAEPVSPFTLGGALLIVGGCVIAARSAPAAPPEIAALA